MLLKEQERVLLDEINTNVPVSVLNKFLTLVRESGSEDERIAADFLASYLDEWEVPYKLREPELYLSLPKSARLRVTFPVAKEFCAKTPSFSAITGNNAVSGEMAYVATGYAKGINDIFGTAFQEEARDLAGKIVLTEGYTMPGKVQEFTALGAGAIVFISPGENIHEGICTPIWGAPDLGNTDREPAISVLAVSKSDGEELKGMINRGPVFAEYETHLEKGWMVCPLIDAFIEGTEEPEEYVLLHGHLDSWHEGIGDNATGNAGLLEMIRIFHKNKSKLKRSIRVVIWPGHSTGSYAGSAWFADHFGLDLERNCIAQVNCDSPGCRWATSYDYMMWTSEADAFCKEAIKDAVGQKSKGARPIRAGDYSFNNIGITSYFMLSSSIPEEALKEKGYYPVGGCGGNIDWHTEEDLMHVADLDILIKDIKIYLIGVLRAVNAAVHPFDFAAVAKEFQTTIQFYQEHAETHFDFSPSLKQARKLEQELLVFNERLKELKEMPLTDPEIRIANTKQKKLARILIPINFTRAGKFRHDPALNVPPLPDLAPAAELKQMEEGSHEYKVLKTHLMRGQNRVVWALQEAGRLIGG
ncbi:M28 family peptidase [Planomicrobium sp. CPCC 101110]|uniref:M28 family peptidase n=1 Tax=Planomicrobium sp. CPCC 101110 TaxID=2599619 RepID=UPI0011B443F5|nr:M28 family peptidase [Planomicrobium sp. CPCC 101110]TWT25457.1 M28 family peptidase [Planomicrobium sp. CPCC 101110]